MSKTQRGEQNPRLAYDVTDYLAAAMTAHGQEQITGYMQGMTNIEDAGGMRPIDAELKTRKYLAMYSVEASEKPWDIKRAMFRDLGPTVMLCGTICEWFDYSTPGNIHFGYILGLSGIDPTVAAALGGALENLDLLTNGDLAGMTQLPCPLFCDNAQDQAAVNFGYQLAQRYPQGITPEELRSELTLDITSTFQRPQTPGIPLYRPAGGNYGPDHFNYYP